MSKLVEVFRSPYTAEAQIKASVLQDRGVQATVISPDLAASAGAGAHIMPARVMVPENQVPQARETIAALEAMVEADGSAGPERCPSCGARWEPGFAVCWQCQHELEAPDQGETST